MLDFLRAEAVIKRIIDSQLLPWKASSNKDVTFFPSGTLTAKTVPY
jgi:hypothetical protein